jgi:hypothetical protein
MGDMANGNWDEEFGKVKGFLQKTRADFKRFGHEVKQEAERLVQEVQKPETQEKLRQGLGQAQSWAKQTAEELAGLVNEGVKKAEVAFKEKGGQVSERVSDFATRPVDGPQKPPAAAAPPAPAVTAPSPAPAPSAPAPTPRAAKKPLGTRAKKGTATKPATPKSIGKPPRTSTRRGS